MVQTCQIVDGQRVYNLTWDAHCSGTVHWVGHYLRHIHIWK
jgi:hypothetical protein